MPNPLFSSYRAGENRVTSSMLAVFERLDLALVEQLLSVATGAELRTVAFENQVVGVSSTPDARISARFTWFFETKTVRGAYVGEGHARQQVREHAALVRGDAEALLFVLTPDPVAPPWFAELDGVDDDVRTRVLWLGFRDLAEAIRAVTTDTTRLIGEQSRFLLAELVALFETDGLLTSDDTVVVAARAAWPEYQRYGAYVGQPHRAFREGLTHFAFYTDGAIQPLVARIECHIPALPFTRVEAEARRAKGETRVAEVIEQLLDDGARTDGESYCLLLLSGPSASEAVVLDHAVVNDTVTAGGRGAAWTQRQRYTRLDVLAKARRTSEL